MNPRADLWKDAAAQGPLGDLCDRIVAAAPLNRRLLAAVDAMPANHRQRYSLPAWERQRLEALHRASQLAERATKVAA